MVSLPTLPKKENSKPVQPKKVDNRINIKSSQRVFIAGKTGSGKTTLAESMLFPVKRLIYVDSKDAVDNEKYNLKDLSDNNLDKVARGDDIRVRVVYTDDAFKYFQAAYKSGNIYILIDELSAIIKPKGDPPQEFLDLWQRGRSKNIGAWALTQAPVSIPLVTMREAEHFFCFQLNLEDDRKRMAQVMGKAITARPVTKRYAFYYKYIDDDKPDPIYFGNGIKL